MLLIYVLRHDYNRERAMEQLQNLRDQLELQRFLRECEEFGFWCQDKMIQAHDETYRSAKTIHSKWTRHQAFQAELDANKDRLDKILEVKCSGPNISSEGCNCCSLCYSKQCKYLH